MKIFFSILILFFSFEHLRITSSVYGYTTLYQLDIPSVLIVWLRILFFVLLIFLSYWNFKKVKRKISFMLIAVIFLICSFFVAVSLIDLINTFKYGVGSTMISFIDFLGYFFISIYFTFIAKYSFKMDK